MASWSEFVAEAPRIAEVFVRRHTATGYLCLLATIRSYGSPRISPMEPRIFEDWLLLVGMPDTTKYRDLGRDPGFCLHTGTVDPYVADGDAKLWGEAVNLQDCGLHERFATFCSGRPGSICGGRYSTLSTSPISPLRHRWPLRMACCR